MKTPREILFGRHRSVEPKLDAVRQEALANLARRSLPSGAGDEVTGLILPKQTIGDSLHRFLLSLRWHLAGMSAVWVLVVALKLSTHDEPHVVTGNSSVSLAIIAELRQQKLLFAELIGSRETRDAEPPKSFLPRPRSERRHGILRA